MYGGAAVFALVMYFKPDRSVRTWAAPEAEKRLDEAGICLLYTSDAADDMPYV